ncbi:MAG: hypothetical protein EVJ48_01755 [Candidatus Acidulodesulfobacterium acidiphilum]|uniref:Uncharacterized protein n=1 Tax=Candidatus Acidulodesulfobacterium acidiphilum TaxID=2597224 RepID=A0A520XGC9_9DELT|nr:MAG: hypothetical protein EVJ48_01755 [Candidatus Acidulodesulfobacterium acidiphilum]
MKYFFYNTQTDLKNAIHFLACQEFSTAVEFIEDAQKRIEKILKEGFLYDAKEILSKEKIIKKYPSIESKLIKAIAESDKYCGNNGEIINRAEEEDFYVQRGFDIDTGEIKKIKISCSPVLGEDPLEIDL